MNAVLQDKVPTAAVPHSPPRTSRPFPPAPTSPAHSSTWTCKLVECQPNEMEDKKERMRMCTYPELTASNPQAGTCSLPSTSMPHAGDLGQVVDTPALPADPKATAMDQIASEMVTSSVTVDHLKDQLEELSRRFSARGRTCERLRRELEEYDSMVQMLEEKDAVLEEKYASASHQLTSFQTEASIAVTASAERPDPKIVAEQRLLTSENVALKLSLSEAKDAESAALSEASVAEAQAQSMHAELVRVLRTRDREISQQVKGSPSDWDVKDHNSRHKSECNVLRAERDEAIARAREGSILWKKEYREHEEKAFAESLAVQSQELQRLRSLNQSDDLWSNLRHVRAEMKDAQVEYTSQVMEVQEAKFLDLQRSRAEMKNAQVEHTAQMEVLEARLHSAHAQAQGAVKEETHINTQLPSEVQAQAHVIKQVQAEYNELKVGKVCQDSSDPVDQLKLELQQAREELRIERAKPELQSEAQHDDLRKLRAEFHEYRLEVREAASGDAVHQHGQTRLSRSSSAPYSRFMAPG